jgi:ATP-binding cassette subfamily C protein CydC
VLCSAALALEHGSITGAELVMLLLFAAASFESVGGMPMALHHYHSAVISASRLLELAGAATSIAESAPLPQLSGSVSVSFRGVDFAYPQGNQVLRGFNLELPAGGRIALTGPSGCGKSTVASLLCGDLEYSGSIRVNGLDLRDIAAAGDLSFLSLQLQNTHIFNTTIRDNLIIARPEATDDEIATVIYAAALDEWIAGLPEGLETRVGEGGNEISGGEARRIAVARTLLKNAPLLVLDEPTEGLDRVTEHKLLQRLDHCLAGRSLLLITHRNAPLQIVDRVVRLPAHYSDEQGGLGAVD